MVEWIESGKFNNNFFHGDMVESGATEEQEVGGCLLDKYSAIKEENGMADFANDLKVDLAACCTKGDGKGGVDGGTCVKELTPAYDLITEVTDGKSGKDVKDPNVVKTMSIILEAARKRLSGAKLVTKAQTLLKNKADL